MGSYDLARKTVELLRDIITQHKFAKTSTTRHFIDIIKEIGRELNQVKPCEYVVGNMVRRVLQIVREAYVACQAEEGPDPSKEPSKEPPVPSSITRTNSHASFTAANLRANSTLQTLFNGEDPLDFSASLDKTMYLALKENIINDLKDLLDEIETSAKNISDQALEHIHQGEVIMTIGASRTVELFLKKAAKRKFQVIVAESAPFCKGHDLAMSLSAAGIETTVITDSAIFAMMSQVNKVIIGAKAVMADGGLLGLNGCHSLALAAKCHSVPVIVCSSIFKLTPKYLRSYDQDFNTLLSPHDVLPYSAGSVVSQASYVHPLFDYIPPELVTLFLNNVSVSAPSFVYRLLSDYYHEDDYDLD